MSRCDYDGVFYRVFCVTLLATAFTFTVILTNVFIDIDGLLAKKAKQSHENEPNGNEAATVSSYEKTDESVNDKNDIDDHPDSDLRTKRSLDASNFVIYMKKHKMKKIYTRQLEKLLEQLKIEDEESFDNVLNEDKHVATTTAELADKKLNNQKHHKRMNYPNANFMNQNLSPQNLNSIHLESSALHGMTYKSKTQTLRNTSERLITHSLENVNIISSPLNKESPLSSNVMKKNGQQYDEKKQSDLAFGENDLNVIFKLKEWDQQFKNNHLPDIKLNTKETNNSLTLKFSENKPIRHVKLSLKKEKNQNNRSKRHIKLRRNEMEVSTPRLKPSRNGMKKPDDDLYVEIETHFDGKGAKGERKKKLVRNLIDRIQKAIRSDGDSQDADNHVNKITKRLQIKKRTQNPIKHKHNKPLSRMSRYSSIEHRRLNPINELEMRDVSRDLKDVSLEENLEEPYGIFTDSNTPTLSNLEKSIEITNAEINNVLNSGVPQRFQVPLNTDDNIGPAQVQNTYADTGNVTLFIKDIDGSGFSVGFNQYMDEPPDVESMKIFSGLENVIKNYHDNYEQNPGVNDIDNSIERRHELGHELTKRNIPYYQNKHVLLRRAVHELENENYNSKDNIIYDKKTSPYEKYQDILQMPNKKSISSDYEYKLRDYNYNPKNIKIITKDIKIKALPLVLDENIFEKKLNPAEIFSLANLLLNDKRKKRSVNVQRITNLKSRIKLNRYLNTKTMQAKKVFLKNKRNKRQLDKIRIIASDRLHHSTKTSDENIYIVPGANLFSNRAVLREIELPESDIGDDRGEEQGEDTIPYAVEEPNLEQTFHPNVFGAKYSRNPLMSKYPHIFTEGVTGSKELHFGNENTYLMSGNKHSLGFDNLLGIQGTSENTGSGEKHLPGIVDAILPPSPSKNTYKVTVKILPKNLTNTNSGFKEMHTVINKTYNKNGVQYYSLVNVSEISKIEKINKSKEFLNHQYENMANAAQEQEEKMKFLLGLQKLKIEQQLQHLNREKDNLEAMLREKTEANERSEFSDLFKGVVPKNNDVKHLSNEPYVGPVHIQEIVPIEHTTTSTSSTTAKNIEPISVLRVEPKPEPVKTKIETSIKENQNFTNEILNRINKNTDILQSFLMKLVEKLDPTSRNQATTQQTIIEHITEDTKHLKAHAELSKDLGMNIHHIHDSFFIDHHHKNDSHYAIPFVYAYQQPYSSANKPMLPMAKVVYHGHIHTNTIHKHPSDNWKYNPNTSKLVHSPLKHDNATRFFIDRMARNDAPVSPKATETLDYKRNHTATINIR